MRRTVEEIIALVRAAPRENEDVQVDPQDCDLFRRHFSRSFYQVSLPSLHPPNVESLVFGGCWSK